MMSEIETITLSGVSEDRKRAFEELTANLDYHFIDRSLLLTAMCHRSFIHQIKDASIRNRLGEDNQRLEFLGDAVLGLCISTLLYHQFPNLKEGVLSRMRAGLVNESQLAEMSRRIGIPEGLLLGRGEVATGGRDKNSILADALEAIVAAIYLDGGFHAALRVVKSLWGELIVRSSTNDFLKDFKTRLQEKTQRTLGQTPEYRLTKAEGPDHARTFEVTLLLDARVVSTGYGLSKKEAEQSAAREALKIMDEDDQ